jgi:uncharacterized protein
MIKLFIWQWGVIAAPIVGVVGFLLFAAGSQIHAWHLSWIWAVIGVVFIGWRWLLVTWTRPALAEIDEIVAEITAQMPLSPQADPRSGSKISGSKIQRAETALAEILAQAREDLPIWADWNTFWQRALSLISAIAQVYNPEAKQPLLNIYIPQAYVLLRGTIDDLNEWMQKMAPVLNQVTIEQALQAYQVYQKLQPAARRVLQVWSWARWLVNPAAAAARTITQGTRTKANQELLGNLNQVMREAVLRNLARQAIALYSGTLVAPEVTSPDEPNLKAQSLKEILAQATPIGAVTEKPVSLMVVGRTSAGKSSLINALFVAPVAAVDALPSTDTIRDYHWEAETGEGLTLWDTPGYEQVNRQADRARLLEQAREVDLLLLATPALDPALQMDLDFLRDLQIAMPDLPTIVVVTQVDRLRPIQEWQPPYDWQTGDRPKEVNIREAVNYRAGILANLAAIVPVVTLSDTRIWGIEDLSLVILANVDGAKQARLARFLRNLDARTVAAAALIDRYSFRMTTQQGLTAFLKSPILQFISQLTTGSPALAILLTEKIPVEELPLVIGKAQMAKELHNLLAPSASFDLIALWPHLIDQRGTPDRNAWEFGQMLIASWLPAKETPEQKTML